MQFLALLSLATSAVAYSVTFPTAGTNWTSVGPNKFTWNRVDTDALNFTLLLTNTDRSVMPKDNLQLAALVDGTQGKFNVNPPSTDFPVGKGFRLNLVKDAEDINTILAQSDQFDIVLSTASSSSGSVSAVSTTPAAGASATTGGSATSAGPVTGTDSGPLSSDSASPTATPNGAVGQTVRAGALGLAVLGAVAYAL